MSHYCLPPYWPWVPVPASRGPWSARQPVAVAFKQHRTPTNTLANQSVINGYGTRLFQLCATCETEAILSHDVHGVKPRRLQILRI